MRRTIMAGVLGALTTNVLHEVVRRTVPNAPRVDLLGMQALAKMVSIRFEPPKGRTLYVTTLVGDFLSNTAYFSLIGAAPRSRAATLGSLIGIAAGIGAVVLPRPLALSAETTSRTAITSLLTIALYGAGGLVTGLALRD